MPASRDDAKTVVIDGLRYPLGAPVERSQLGIYVRKFIVGDAQFDSDDYQSAVIYGNLSGGIGIEDSDEGADTTRYWTGVMDTRSPRMIGLPPLVTSPAAPQAGAARPIGVVGTQFYMCFDDDAYGWDDTTGAWHVTTNDLDFAPVNKCVNFDGRVWVPQGTNGIRAVTETGAANGTLTEALITAAPAAVALATWNDALYAVATTGKLYKLLQGETSWAIVENAAGTDLVINTSDTPRNLVSYYNRAGEPTLWLITDRAAYQFYESAVEWRKSSIAFPHHPNTARPVAIWRTGEDLWVANGMDVVRQTTGNAIVPLASGVSRDQGVPQEYRGTILDLEPEVSQLFALVGAGTDSGDYQYNDTVGSAGTGNGEFADVRGLAFDSTGNLYACDENNERVQKFSSGLTFDSVIIAGGAGTGNGQFSSDNGPYDLALDSSNNIYVLDRGNQRVQKFLADGTFSSVLINGAGPGTATGWALQTTVGSSGSATNQFQDPRGVAIDSSGNIFVADFTNNRILKLNSSGVYQTHVTVTGPKFLCVDSTGLVYATTNGDSSLGDRVNRYSNTLVLADTNTAVGNGPTRGIATDSTHVYATSENRVYKLLCTTLNEVTHWGTSGSGNGQFSSPTGVAVNAGVVSVVDAGNSRVQRFDTTGTYQSQFSIGSGGQGIAVDTGGQLLVATSGAVTRYTTAGVMVDSFLQTGAYGLAVTTGDVVWVANNTGDSIAKWDEAAGGGNTGTAAGQFQNPESLDLNQTSGRIYVADTGNHRVQYFTSAGVYEGTWGSAGTGTSQFNGPNGLAVNQTTGSVYVLDAGNDRVQYFDATGTYLGQFGSSGTSLGQFQTPTCIAVSPTNGDIFVGDSTRDTVQRFSEAGDAQGDIGSTGTGNGQFASPSGVVIGSTGSVYVADLSNEDIQEFTATISTAFNAVPTLHAWPGTGWHMLWEGSSNAIFPTWAAVSAPSTHYRLWWGDTAGNAYYLTLWRGFENFNQARIAGTAFFASSGYFVTSKFDAGMLGFRKAASHVTLMPVTDTISATETFTVEFAIDDGAWEPLGVLNAATLGDADSVSFSFGAAGRAFQTIRFKITAARGSSTTLSPALRALTLFFVKVPQAARSFVFTIVPTSSEVGTFADSDGVTRTGQDMFNELDDLADNDDFFDVSYNGQTFSHCRFAGTTGHDDLVGTGGKRVVSIIQLPVPA
jgi:tripartite motif-containing protein 71